MELHHRAGAKGKISQLIVTRLLTISVSKRQPQHYFFSVQRMQFPHTVSYYFQCFLFSICLWLIGVGSTNAQISVSGYTPKTERAKTEAAQAEQERRSKLPFSRRSAQIKLDETPWQRLPPLDPKWLNDRKQEKRVRVGVVRRLAEPLTGGSEKAYEVAGGKVFVSRVIVTGALGVRVHFTAADLPPDAHILVYAPTATGEVLGPYSQRGPNNTGDFWTPLITGDSVVIEYFTPAASVLAATPPYRVSEISHTFRQLISSAAQPEDDAALCNVEVPAEWKEAAKSVAAITYLTPRYEYACSATLLNSTGNTGVPYLLTANHCVSRPLEASSLLVTWFKDSASPNNRKSNNGADIMVTGFGGDFTLLKLRQAPPAGVRFAGWTTEPPAVGTAVTGIHHPQNSYHRIAFGKTRADVCPPEIPAEICSTFQPVQWEAGITEPGSSGSGLLVGSATDPKLVGTLTGGSSACNNPQGMDIYGRFASYFPALEFYLNGTSCAYRLDAIEKYIGASGGEAIVNLNTQGSGACPWTAVSLSSWLQITSGSNGSGAAAISYNAEPNPGSELRIGYLKVAGQLVAVTQAGSGNSCGKTPETITSGERVFYTRELTSNDCNSLLLAGAKADRFTLNGKAGQQVAIEIFTDTFEPFVSIFGPDGRLLAYDPYGRIGYRAPGSFLVLPTDGNYTIEVTSNDPEGLGTYNLWFYKGCDCTVTSGQKTFEGKGSQSEFTLNLPPDCAWQVEYKPDWITINSPASGVGTSKVTFTVAAATLTNQQRTGYIRFFFPSTSSSNRTQFGDIIQSFPCAYSLSPFTTTLGVMGITDGVVLLDKGGYCPVPEIKSDSAWLTIPAPPIQYLNYVRFAVRNANLSPSPRTAKIIANEATYTITQPGLGAACTIGSIAIGQTIKSTLDQNCPVPSVNWAPPPDFYRGSYYAFNGTAGQQIKISVSTTERIHELHLIDPDGQDVPLEHGSTFSSLWTPKQGAYALLKTGRYAIAVGGYSLQAMPVNFTLSLTAFNGSNCDWTVTPTDVSLLGAGGQAQIQITKAGGTSCTWQLQSNEPWVSATTASGDADGNITLQIAPNPGSLRTGFISIAGQHVRVFQEQTAPLGIVSGASYTRQFAPGAIASVFGTNLATLTMGAASLPLPYELGGTTVTLLRDRTYSPHTLTTQLFYVSPTQVNFLLPNFFLQPGEDLTVLVTDASGYRSLGQIKVDAVAPALFSAQADGKGVAAAVIQRVKGDVQSYEPVAEHSGEGFVHKAIDLGNADERVYLILFGTGIRHRRSAEPVIAHLGDVAVEVEYAGDQRQYAGLDQVNILLPKSLRGKGVVPVSLVVDRKTTNSVEIKLAP